MTYLRFPTHNDACLARRSDQIAGFLHRLIVALHHCRRLQAAVVIRQYKHLVDPACGYLASGESTKGNPANVRK
jgi:hypothetical protein